MARNPTWFNQGQTIVDPNRVRELDEDNLLGTGGYEDVAPLQVGPNPVRRIADYEGLEVSPDLTAVATPTPEATPAGEGTGSYIEDAQKATGTQATTPEAMFSSHYTKKQWDDANAEQEAANQLMTKDGGVNPSRLVNAAPSWYESKKPPPGHNTWAAASQALGGALAAPHLQSLKDPLRPAGLKQGDARSAATAQGLSTILSSLFTSGTDKYKANQDAALKEAQMQHTLPGGKSQGQIRSDIAKDRVAQMQRDRYQDDLETNRQFVRKIKLADRDPNDPQAQAIAAQLEAAGVPPAEIQNMTFEMAKVRQGQINSGIQARDRAGADTAKQQNTERNLILEADIKRNTDIDKEIRAAESDRNRAYVPGVRWVNNTPQGEKSVQETRQLYKDTKGFVDRIDRVRAIQPRIEAIARQYARDHGLGDDVGKALAMMGPVTRWTNTFGPEAKALANEAVILQTAIQNFIRSESYSNLGVMQKWEDLKTKAIEPLAGDPTAFLRGEEMWKALRNDVDKNWVDGVHAYGGLLEGDADPGAPPGARTPEQQRDATPRPVVPPRASYDPTTKRVVTEPVPLRDPDTVPTIPGATAPSAEDQARIDGARAKAAAQPAPAPTKAPPPGTKHYTITAGNKTSEADFTPEEYEKFVKAQAERIASGKLKIVGG
jgi:hypothetical protein